MSDPVRDLLNTNQVAALLKSSRKTVLRLLDEAELPAYQMPRTRAYRYSKLEIIEWLKKHPAAQDRRHR